MKCTNAGCWGLHSTPHGNSPALLVERAQNDIKKAQAKAQRETDAALGLSTTEVHPERLKVVTQMARVVMMAAINLRSDSSDVLLSYECFLQFSLAVTVQVRAIWHSCACPGEAVLDLSIGDGSAYARQAVAVQIVSVLKTCFTRMKESVDGVDLQSVEKSLGVLSVHLSAIHAKLLEARRR